MLILVRSFSYTPDTIFSAKFLIQSSCCFRLVGRFCLIITHLMLCLMKSLNYIPDANFNEEFLLLTSCIVSGFSEEFCCFCCFTLLILPF